jgi:hypothetical protein
MLAVVFFRISVKLTHGLRPGRRPPWGALNLCDAGNESVGCGIRTTVLRRNDVQRGKLPGLEFPLFAASAGPAGDRRQPGTALQAVIKILRGFSQWREAFCFG